MDRNKVQQLIESLDPEEALAAMARAVKNLFPLTSQEARLQFVVDLIGEGEQDKVTSMVHL
jgi:hypothetical protein